MADFTHAALISALLLATSVWIGGIAAITVVARTSSQALSSANRVALFRTLGRAYLPVGVGALAAAYASGGALLWSRSWDGVQIAIVTLAVILLLVLGIAVKQARRMTRLRAAAIATDNEPGQVAGSPDETPGNDRIRAGALWAAVLRSSIGAISLALVILGAVLAG